MVCGSDNQGHGFTLERGWHGGVLCWVVSGWVHCRHTWTPAGLLCGTEAGAVCGPHAVLMCSHRHFWGRALLWGCLLFGWEIHGVCVWGHVFPKHTG